MNHSLRFAYIRVIIAIVCAFTAAHVEARIEEHEMEQERLSGYKEHIVENQIYDRERLRSYRAYLETVEKDLFDKHKSLREFRKEKKEDKKEDLQKANITAVYTFDKEIATVQNANCKLSKSKKTVFLKQNIWNVLKNNKLMNNSISFNP